MDLKTQLSFLPREIQFLIVKLCCKDFTFEKDKICLSIDVKLFKVEGNYQFQVYCWYGIKLPNENDEAILCPFFHRVYPRELERTFCVLSKKIFNQLESLDFQSKYFVKRTLLEGGTYGPIRLGVASRQGVTFHKTSNCIFNQEIVENEIEDYFLNKGLPINNVKLAEQQLVALCQGKIKTAVDQYNKSSANNLYKFYEKKKKDYYYLCKAIPDAQIILDRNIQNQKIYQLRQIK